MRSNATLTYFIARTCFSIDVNGHVVHVIHVIHPFSLLKYKLTLLGLTHGLKSYLKKENKKLSNWNHNLTIEEPQCRKKKDVTRRGSTEKKGRLMRAIIITSSTWCQRLFKNVKKWIGLEMRRVEASQSQPKARIQENAIPEVRLGWWLNTQSRSHWTLWWKMTLNLTMHFVFVFCFKFSCMWYDQFLSEWCF